MRLILFFMLCPLVSVSQISNNDFLNKYSGLLYGFKTVNNEVFQSQGTSFFYKIDSITYLITAAHVVNGCANGFKDTTSPDWMMYYHLPDSISKIEWHLKLDTRYIHDTAICRDKDNYPDVFVHKVGKVNNLNINYVSSFNNKLPKISDELIFFGFPSKNRSDTENVFSQKPSLFKSVYFSIKKTYKNFKSDNYPYFEISIKDNFIDSTMIGFSGAPVFIRDFKTKEMTFAGILSAVDLNRNSIYVVKPKFIIDYLIE